MMGILKVNPDAEAKTFETVKPGTYRMRIKEVIDRNPEKNDLRISLEFVSPAIELLGLTGEPLKGLPGSLFDYVGLNYDKQWKLRQLVEACGRTWGDLDPVEDLRGLELDVVVKIEPYEGEQKNKVARYVVKKD